jgi:ribosomal protein S18 acetylase RimI-like enzyme
MSQPEKAASHNPEPTNTTHSYPLTETAVRQLPPDDLAQLKAFVQLEGKLIGLNPQYVSELESEIMRLLGGKTAMVQEMTSALFVASYDGIDKARCVALINRRYQEAKREKVGFIGYFAAAPDAESEVTALLNTAESWLQAHAVERIIAPCNGAGLLGFGLLTTDFKDDPVFPFQWHPPYYQTYFQNAAYQPSYPLWVYIIDFSSAKFQAAQQRVQGNQAVHVRPIDTDQWDTDLEIYRHLFNECFVDEWEFHPYTEAEFRWFFNVLKRTPAVKQMLIAEVEGQPAGFCWGMPDWTPMFRALKGKMGFWQIIKMIFHAGRYKRAGLLGIGVLPDYRGSGAAQALAVHLYNMYQKRGFKEAFYFTVNDTNIPSRRFAESIGGTGKIQYYCYDKQLVSG